MLRSTVGTGLEKDATNVVLFHEVLCRGILWSNSMVDETFQEDCLPMESDVSPQAVDMQQEASRKEWGVHGWLSASACPV